MVVALTLVRGGDHARYELSAPLIGAAGLTPVAAWTALRRGRDPTVAGLGFAATSLLLLGALTVFSGAGLVLVPLGAIAAAALGWALRRGSRSQWIANGGGALTSATVVVLLVTLQAPPLVDCGADRARVSFDTGDRVSTSVNGARESGEILKPGRTIHFICDGGRLVDFGG